MLESRHGWVAPCCAVRTYRVARFYTVFRCGAERTFHLLNLNDVCRKAAPCWTTCFMFAGHFAVDSDQKPSAVVQTSKAAGRCWLLADVLFAATPPNKYDGNVVLAWLPVLARREALQLLAQNLQHLAPQIPSARRLRYAPTAASTGARQSYVYCG